MHRGSLFLMALLLACAPAAETDDDDDVADEVPDPDPPAALAELSSGECPDLSEPGTSTFLSAGLERTVTVLFPEDGPAGMPVLFYWHSLGTTASQWINWFGLNSLAEDEEVIVIVPASLDTELFEWDWVNPDEGDAQLFDDLRTCAVTELEADVGRVYSAGFSSGGVWTTWLAMHRSEQLAAIYSMSGGTVINLPYETPARKIPVFAMSGGDADVWPNEATPLADFETATQELVAALLADGHFVVQCEHDYGHSPGDNAEDMMAEWLLRHEYDVPSPWDAGGRSLTEDFDDYCFEASID